MNVFKAPEWILSETFAGKAIKVTVIGAGGTGSALLSKLAQMHSTLLRLGAQGLDVTVFDDDTVSATNIGRQAFYPMDIGQPKAQVLVERFNSFLGTKWQYEVERFDHASPIPFGIIFTCVDNPMTRVNVGKRLVDNMNAKHSRWSNRTILWIDGGNDSSSGQVVMGCFPHSDEKEAIRVPSVYDLFGERLEKAEYNQTDSCSHEEAISRQDFGINDTIAAQMAQLLWRIVRHGELTYHGVMVDLKTGEHRPLPINPLNWQLMGFDEDTSKEVVTA